MAMLLAVCTEDPAPLVAGEVREFTGSMSLSGKRHRLANYPTAVPPAIFRVGGALILSGPARPNVGFRAEFIGFSNSDTGLQARGVWTDERGDRAFSELLSRELGPGKTVTGHFVGGTGRYSEISGGYTITWEYIMDAEELQPCWRMRPPC